MSTTIELTQLPYSRRTAAIVGDTLSAPGCSLVRAPSTSSAVFDAGSFSFDVPGFYSFSSAAAGYSIVVFPIAALSLYADVNAKQRVTVSTLQTLVQDPRVTQATCQATLEAGSHGLEDRILGGGVLNL